LNREKGLLFLKSGSVCAFRGCGRSLIEPGGEGDGDAIIGEVARIVGASRQGPRGDEPLDDTERNRHTNLILLCPTHHTIVDGQLQQRSHERDPSLGARASLPA
jgi:hypothetical protein